MSTEELIPLIENDLKHAEKNEGLSSISFVFSSVTIMLGSTTLSIPWAFSHAGPYIGLFLLLFLGLCCFYTCIKIVEHYPEFENLPSASSYYISRILGFIGDISSPFVLLGASLAYHILFSDNLFLFLQDIGIKRLRYEYFPILLVILVLILQLFPIQKLMQISSFGVLCTVYIFIFGIVISLKKGLVFKNIERSGSPFDFAGVLFLSFFIHNIIISLSKNHRQKEKLKRDISFSFLIVLLIYGIFGTCCYFAFYSKVNNIQNFLENIQNNFFGDFAQLLFSIQILVVYPLLASQFHQDIITLSPLKLNDTTLKRTKFIIYLLLIVNCVLATFMKDHYGDVVKMFGAFFGMYYTYFLPGITDIFKIFKTEGIQLKNLWMVLFDCLIIGFGLTVSISQVYSSFF
eukprot:TRINITY_DN1801_c0_g1_i1.p1 TRINITY_DN1801_c0_g1~~TRINITY_DN1801_c0_g1_i1.p1  ORF type:complete len:403 (-),score=95.33 TRINITY_DN1801_c0_g1_i1:40-1248(-)